MGLKDFYQGLEDSYYGFLDSLDRKGLRVYKVVDAIEGKNIPSFPIAILLVLVIIAGLVYFFMTPGMLAFGQANFNLEVTDTDGNPIQGVVVQLTVNDQPAIAKTTDSSGKISLSVPLNAEVEAEIVKSGYESETKNFTVSRADYSSSVQLISEINVLSKTIQLKDYTSGSLIDETLQVSFHCSDNTSYSVSKTVSNGEVTLNDVPSDCGNLYINQSRYELEDNALDLESGETLAVFFQETAVERGQASVTVKSAVTGDLLPGMVVRLYTNGDSFFDQEFTAESGTALFVDVPAGSYYVSVSDSAGIYESYTGSADVKQVNADSTTYYTVDLQRGTVGKVQVKAVDSSNNAVANAAVTLFKSSSQQEIGSTAYTDAEGKAVFNVAELGPYYAKIDHPDYLIETVSNLQKTPEGEFNLVQLTVANAGNARSLALKVEDEVGEPIQGVRGRLVKGTEIIGQERVTGADGVLYWDRLEEGNYQVNMLKPGYGEKLSDLLSVRARQENYYTVSLPLGSGSLSIEVVDGEGQAVSGALISVYDYYNNQRIDNDVVTDSSGLRTINLRSDRKVYLKVNATDYLMHQTIPVQMVKDSTKELKVTLLKDVPSFSLEFLGLYLKDQIATNALSGGTKYLGKFRLEIPEGSSLDQALAHVRTGNSEAGRVNAMEEDDLYIKDIIVGNASVTKGTSYYPNTGYAEDLRHLTSGSSKWANIAFSDPEPGTYDIYAEIQVKEIERGNLALHYRAEGLQSNRYLRNPRDNVLGNLEQTGEKQALYANARQQLYSVGASSLCSQEGFCNVFVISDLTAGVDSAITDEYPASISNDYAFFFTLTNSSASAYSDVTLKIENETSGLDFSDYALTVKGQERTGSLQAPLLERQIGSLGVNEVVFGNVEFSALKEGSNTLRLQLISDRQVVYEQLININVNPAREMNLLVSPKTLVPFIDNDLLVTVSSNETGIAGANVKVYVNEELMTTGLTDGQGIYAFPLGAPGNGDVVKVEAEKAGYKKASAETTVTEQLLYMQPGQIQQTMVTSSGLEFYENEVTLMNGTNIPLTLTRLGVSGNLQDLVEINYVQNYANTDLVPGEEVPLILELSLTDKGKTVREVTQIEADLVFYVYNEEFEREWSSSLPVLITIGFGNELDSKDCLVIDPLNWNVFTSNNTRSIEVRMRNNCQIDGSSIALQDLEARVSRGNENEIGKFRLEEGLIGGQGIELSEQFKRISDIVPAGSDNTFVLSFTPADVKAANATPSIIFKAVNRTSHGDEKLEVIFKTDVQVNDLTECVQVKDTQNLLVESCPLGYGMANYALQYSSNYRQRPPYLVPEMHGQGTPSSYRPTYINSKNQAYANTNAGRVDRSSQQFGNYQDLYQNRNPSYYHADPRLDVYSYGALNQYSAMYAGCGTGSFRVENNCTATVEVDMDTPSSITVQPDEGFELKPGDDAKITIEQGYRVGKYPITVGAKIKGSDEGSKIIDTVDLTVRTTSQLGDQCISLSDGRFSFDNPLRDSVPGQIVNSCYDQGYHLPVNAITINSFRNFETGAGFEIIDRVLVETPYAAGGVEYLTFRLYRNLDYRNKAKFQGGQNIVQDVLGLRKFYNGLIRGIEERGELLIQYRDPFEQPRTKREIIVIQDYWQGAETLAESGLIEFGNPNIKSQQCINGKDNKRRPNGIVEIKGLRGGALEDIDFQEKDNAGNSIFKREIEPPLIIVDVNHCSDFDALTDLKPVDPNTIRRLADNGLEISVELASTKILGTPDNTVEVTIKRNNARLTGRAVPFEVVMTANLVRGNPVGKVDPIVFVLKGNVEPLQKYEGFSDEASDEIAKAAEELVKAAGTSGVTQEQIDAAAQQLERQTGQSVTELTQALANAVNAAARDAGTPGTSTGTAAGECYAGGTLNKEFFNKVQYKWGADDINISNNPLSTQFNCSNGETICDATQATLEMTDRMIKINSEIVNNLKEASLVKTDNNVNDGVLIKYCSLDNLNLCKTLLNNEDIYRLFKKKFDSYDSNAEKNAVLFLDDQNMVVGYPLSRNVFAGANLSTIEDASPAEIETANLKTLLQQINNALGKIDGYEGRDNVVLVFNNADNDTRLNTVLENIGAKKLEGSTKYYLAYNEFKPFMDNLIAKCTEASSGCDDATKKIDLTYTIGHPSITSISVSDLNVDDLKKIIASLVQVREAITNNSDALKLEGKTGDDLQKAIDARQKVLNEAADSAFKLKYADSEVTVKKFQEKLDALSNPTLYLMDVDFDSKFKAEFKKVYAGEWGLKTADALTVIDVQNPGKYKADLNYLYKATAPVATAAAGTSHTQIPEVSIKMERKEDLDADDKDNPLYLMPLNGDVNAGFMLNEAFNDLKVQKTTSLDIGFSFDSSSSTTAEKKEGFDDVKGGKILTVELGATKSLVFSPSLPSPIGLSVRSTETPVLVNYNVRETTATGAIATVPDNYLTWRFVSSKEVKSGVTGLAGKDFTGKAGSGETYADKKTGNALQLRWDIGTSSGQNAGDLEMYLQTVAFAPQDKDYYVNIDEGTKAGNVKLANSATVTNAYSNSNKPAVALQDPYASDASNKLKDNASLQNIKELNEEGYLCIGGDKDTLEVYWNPKKFLDSSGFNSMKTELKK